MKKLFAYLLFLSLSVSTFAQNGKLISANNYLNAYNSGDGATNLEEGRRVIDEAVADPVTGAMTKAWWYRSQIYQLIDAEATLKTKYSGATLEALKSFQKMKEIGDPKFKDWEDAIKNLQALGTGIFNNGVDAYKAKDYVNAYKYFIAIQDVNDIIESKGEKTTIDLQTSLTNAALCAENSGNKEGSVKVYSTLIAKYPSAKNYYLLVDCYRKQSRADDAKKLTDEALTKYPDDKELLISKINFLLAENKAKDAIEYLKKACDQDPKNEQLMSALGLAYDQAGDGNNARKMYDNILTMNPNSYDGNFGMGSYYFNQAKQLNDQLVTLGASEADKKRSEDITTKRNDLFALAKPYLAKAHLTKPEDAKVNQALNTIDLLTKK